MKTPLEIFDEWILSTVGTDDELPPRFHPIPDDIAEPFTAQRGVSKGRVEALDPMFLPGRKIEIYMDFIDDGACDATSVLYGGIALVGMFKGAIMLPLETFFRMFSHRLVLPDLGNNVVEKKVARFTEGLPNDYNDLINLRKKLRRRWYPRRPNDHTRTGVALLCMQIVWGFLEIHELVHITHGHLEYLYTERGVPFYIRVFRSAAPPALSKDDLDYQSLELWADAKAMSVTLGGMLTESNELLAQGWFPRPQDKVFIWSFSMYTLFRVWGLKVDPAKLHGLTHPPVAVRFQMVVWAASLELETRFPELDKAEFWKAVHAGREAAEDAIVHLGASRLNRGDVAGINDPKTIAHVDELLNHHESVLIPKLQKYARLKIDFVTPQLENVSP